METSLERVQFLLNLMSFLKSHSKIGLQELAEHFQLSEQDMEKILLQELAITGVPPYSPSDYTMIFITSKAGKKHVQLHQREDLRRPVKLTAAEAFALKSTLEVYARSAPIEVRAFIDSILNKITQAMQGKAALSPQTPQFAVRDQSQAIKKRLELIDYAILHSRIIEIEYYSGSHGKLLKRRIHPLLLFEEGTRFFLKAYCELRRAKRSFRIDRIAELDILEQKFIASKTSAQKKETQDALGWDGSKAKGVMVVRFEPVCAEEVLEEWASHYAKADFEKDGSLLLSLPLYSEAWAIGWVLSFGCQAELLEPKYLRQEFVKRLKLMMARNKQALKSP